MTRRIHISDEMRERLARERVSQRRTLNDCARVAQIAGIAAEYDSNNAVSQSVADIAFAIAYRNRDKNLTDEQIASDALRLFYDEMTRMQEFLDSEERSYREYTTHHNVNSSHRFARIAECMYCRADHASDIAAHNALANNDCHMCAAIYAEHDLASRDEADAQLHIASCAFCQTYSTTNESE